MSWNAAIILKDGQVAKGIEVGEGGSPRETGNYLLHFYNTVDRIKALIDLGDIYMLGMNIPSKRFIEKLNQDIKQMKADSVLMDKTTEYADYCFEEQDTIVTCQTDGKEQIKKMNQGKKHLYQVQDQANGKVYLVDRKWLISHKPQISNLGISNNNYYLVVDRYDISWKRQLLWSS